MRLPPALLCGIFIISAIFCETCATDITEPARVIEGVTAAESAGPFLVPSSSPFAPAPPQPLKKSYTISNPESGSDVFGGNKEDPNGVLAGASAGREVIQTNTSTATLPFKAPLPEKRDLSDECLGMSPEVIYLGGSTTLTTSTQGYYTYGGLDSNNNPYFSKEASSLTYYMFYYPAYGRW